MVHGSQFENDLLMNGKPEQIWRNWSDIVVLEHEITSLLFSELPTKFLIVYRWSIGQLDYERNRPANCSHKVQIFVWQHLMQTDGNDLSAGLETGNSEIP